MQNQKSHIRILEERQPKAPQFIVFCRKALLEEEESRGSRPSGDYEAAEAWEGIRI